MSKSGENLMIQSFVSELEATPWQGDPRINLQNLKGNLAKPYQVLQVLRCPRKLKETNTKDEQENQ